MIYTTKYFNVTYYRDDSEFGHCIVENMDNFYIELCNYFGISLSARFDFEIIVANSINDYINYTDKTKGDYQSWMVGYSGLGTRKICILSP